MHIWVCLVAVKMPEEATRSVIGQTGLLLFSLDGLYSEQDICEPDGCNSRWMDSSFITRFVAHRSRKTHSNLRPHENVWFIVDFKVLLNLT